MTGGLNITLFSYDGDLDFGLIVCREMVPDVWNLIDYLKDAIAEMVGLVPPEEPPAKPAKKAAARKPAKKAAARKSAKKAAKKF
jgi:hypothetical protein